MTEPSGLKSKAQVLRDRGIASLVIGAIPFLIGIAGFRGQDGDGYRDPWVVLCLVGGLAILTLGVVLLDRANRTKSD